MTLATLLHAFPAAAAHSRFAHFISVLPVLATGATLVTRQAAKKCRVCEERLDKPFIDLGFQPLANSFIQKEQLGRPEPVHPLRVFFCDRCHLAQAVDFVEAGEIFDEYFYFSSFSQSWLEHARLYVHAVVSKLGLTPRHQVIEIASNDGYLLQYFREQNIPSLGIEPSKTVAQAAIAKGIDTWIQFFGVKTARQIVERRHAADLIVGNNVLAHVPDLHDFVEGVKIALKSSGTATFEFPHVLRLLQESQFDTIYHEHFSYLSLMAAETFFSKHGLAVYDAEELGTHGGSLRLWVKHAGNAALEETPRVADLRTREKSAGLDRPDTYRTLAQNAGRIRRELLAFLEQAKSEGKRVVAYGAPAKGNTLLNYCGIDGTLIDYAVDASPYKQGRYLPGSRLEIFAPEKIFQTRPDYVLVLPWNLRDEITRQMARIAEWNGRFVVPVPHLQTIVPNA